MTRRDWLTLFVALEGAPDGLDPVRIQYGMFLFAMQSLAPQQAKYDFEPYHYGPMSAVVYDDIDALVREQILSASPLKGKRWYRYRATDSGFALGRETLALAETHGWGEAVSELHRIKLQVAAMSFDRLLDDVFDRYPDYAVNSVFRRVS